ncbi:MAG: hypothetical protein CSA36_00510 [Draconibacterium sp.]|nr:MAG: hypothetical protein CSA36_00510 [Draconibacterium sp.]
MKTFKEMLEVIENQAEFDQETKEEIKTEVFYTLDKLKLYSDVFDLFTVNFFKTGNDFLKTKN